MEILRTEVTSRPIEMVCEARVILDGVSHEAWDVLAVLAVLAVLTEMPRVDAWSAMQIRS